MFLLIVERELVLHINTRSATFANNLHGMPRSAAQTAWNSSLSLNLSSEKCAI